jgi:hypothetical protein
MEDYCILVLLYSILITGIFIISLVHHFEIVKIHEQSYNKLKQLHNKHMKEQEVLYENNKYVLFSYVDVLISEKNRNRFKNPSLN